jgi:hypothetical protein
MLVPKDNRHLLLINAEDPSQCTYLRNLEKKKKKKNPASIFLAMYWNLSLKSGDLDLLFFEIWRIWAIFYLKNTLNRSKSDFSSRILAKFRQKKPHWGHNPNQRNRCFKTLKKWRE